VGWKQAQEFISLAGAPTAEGRCRCCEQRKARAALEAAKQRSFEHDENSKLSNEHLDDPLAPVLDSERASVGPDAAVPWLLPRRFQNLTYAGVHDLDALAGMQARLIGDYCAITVLFFSKEMTDMLQNCGEWVS